MRAVDAMGVVQIDSVNVLVRSQELPLFSRLGPHDRSAIPRATASGRLFEYWAHAAAHVPTEQHRLWRWKMESHHDGPWEVARDLRRRRRGYVDEVLARVAAEGPVAAGELSERTSKKNPWWDWDDAKVALEYLFYCGRVTATRRASDFARLYDLPERVIPAEHLDAPTPSRDDAHRELVARAMTSLGVATVKDLADYYRLKQDEVKPRLAELVEDGRILPVSIAEGRGPFFMHAGARTPRQIGARTFVSMFDPVVWNRDRGRWLFDFDYSIEIYTPAAKRKYGYYVLPFVSGERIVGRADLKADRANATLLADGVFAESDTDLDRVAAEIAEELRIMADWLELEHVEVGSRGGLANRVRRAVGTRR